MVVNPEDWVLLEMKALIRAEEISIIYVVKLADQIIEKRDFRCLQPLLMTSLITT